ncbi:MAG: hypothetical protein ACRCTZ_14925 [Sarcina sp.]
MKDLQLKSCYTAQNVITKKLVKITPLKKNKKSYRVEIFDESNIVRYDRTFKENGDTFYVVGTSPLQVYEILEGKRLREVVLGAEISSTKRDIEITQEKIKSNKEEMEYIKKYLKIKEFELEKLEKNLKNMEEEWDTLQEK